MSFNITPVASGYQEIHPYSAMNIDSVKINTSLIMMKEWVIHPRRPRDFPRPERFPEGNLGAGGDGFPNTFPREQVVNMISGDHVFQYHPCCQ